MTTRYAVVAIPAKDEAARIGACLAALAIQRDGCGAPIERGTFEILVLANNCQDETEAEVRRWMALCPHPIDVISVSLPPARSTAGWARKTAMDLAAERLAILGRAADGIILTTDADSSVWPTWVGATLGAFEQGVDAVAGYIDAYPAEIVALGAAFLERGRREDRYLRAMAEIHALCDPRPHDPWPNHRVSSGASLAVTAEAYRAVGGLPPLPVGEDAALTAVLERRGYRVRHAMDVVVSTSCRFDGRAPGGAADTMRFRHERPEAPCDPDIEPPREVLRRAAARGRLRRLHAARRPLPSTWSERYGLSAPIAAALNRMLATASFEEAWAALVSDSPAFARRDPMTPADLPPAIVRADRLLRLLRRLVQCRTNRSSR